MSPNESGDQELRDIGGVKLLLRKAEGIDVKDLKSLVDDTKNLLQRAS